MNTATIQTAAGAFTAHFSERGLCRLEFPQAGRPGRMDPAATGQWPREARRWLALTGASLDRALAGKNPTHLPPLDLSAGTAFQQRIWQALLKIPAGRFRTYAKLAAAVGHSKAARAVGGACGANPIPVLVPCHRVLAAGGGLGGYSGGLDWKRRLLACEGVQPD